MRILFTALAFCLLFSSCDPANNEDTSGYNCTPEGCFQDLANAQYMTLNDCLSVCEEDNSGGGNAINNGDWFYSISLNGNLYSASGNIQDYCYDTGAYAYFSNGELSVNFSILDPTSDCYDSGGYITVGQTFENPFIGLNDSYLYGSEDFLDYTQPCEYQGLDANFNVMWCGIINHYMLDNSTTISELGYELGGLCGYMWWNPNNPFEYYSSPPLPFDLTSLGSIDYDDNGNFIGNNVEGSYTGTLYFLDTSNLSENPTFDEVAALANVPFTVPLDIEINFSVPRSN